MGGPVLSLSRHEKADIIRNHFKHFSVFYNTLREEADLQPSLQISPPAQSLHVSFRGFRTIPARFVDDSCALEAF